MTLWTAVGCIADLLFIYASLLGRDVTRPSFRTPTRKCRMKDTDKKVCNETVQACKVATDRGGVTGLLYASR